MLVSSDRNSVPIVSIILPTYNRAAFLPAAFESIKSQQFADWELVIVDDGSTDETRELAAQFASGTTQPVRYFSQENKGPSAARNTGLNQASGQYIAFFDSDDIWLPHHLRDCVEGLEANADVDWVYGACSIVDHGTSRVLAESTFYADGEPHQFMKLKTTTAGKLQIIRDRRAIELLISGAGLYCGLQSSVIRAHVFARGGFYDETLRAAEDQLLAIEALASGCVLAYFDNVHAVYHVHETNSSAACNMIDVERRLRVFEELARGFEQLPNRIKLTRCQRRAVRRRVSRAYFWQMGYATLWQAGRRRDALAQFSKGISRWPWEWRYWKTYLVSLARVQLLGNENSDSTKS
jgi:glycosyltransferase involved in cell wall biosynthesis